MFGLVGAPVAILVSIVGPHVAQRLLNKGNHDGIALVLTFFAGVTGISVALTVAVNSVPVILAGLAAGMFELAAMTVMPPVVIQLYSPTNIRARLWYAAAHTEWSRDVLYSRSPPFHRCQKLFQ